MKKSFLSVACIFMCTLLFVACGNEESSSSAKQETRQETKTVEVPRFNRDSAYAYVQAQMDYGARTPGSEAHIQTRDYLVQQLKRFEMKPKVQNFSADNYLGEHLKGYNIIGRYNESAAKRLLLMAHWDTRFISDHDKDEASRSTPVPGANDGASGVGVLLEIARILQENPVDIGVDIVFFDLEDQGESEGDDHTTWCLGSQYWSNNPHRSTSQYKYGVLLDMVGAKNAQFQHEAFSRNYAPDVLNKIWNLAAAMGYGNYFQKKNIGGVIDDHYFVNTIAGIPSIDIIDKRNDTNTGFFKHWHTTDDTMDAIDKSTLRAVGQVMTAVIYKESIDELI